MSANDFVVSFLGGVHSNILDLGLKNYYLHRGDNKNPRVFDKNEVIHAEFLCLTLSLLIFSDWLSMIYSPRQTKNTCNS